jgi:glycosyltransferase involved in cell wall biosynthesis
MNILWITNIGFPEAQVLLKGKGSLKSTGGWMLGAAEALIREPGVKLTVATVSSDVKELTHLEGKEISYYLIPLGNGNTHRNPEYRKYWRMITDELLPDVVHIHGSEYSHGLEYVNECGAENVVVSIQGLTSAYYYYYYYGVSVGDILKHITFRDLIRGTLFQEKRQFQRRGEYEKELISKVHHVIGRTCWDKDHVWAINPHAKYHFCNETLRQEFYSGERWKYEDCTPCSIFISQAIYPIKGLHMLFRAMPLIIRHYPETQIRIAGRDVIRRNEGWKEKLKLSGYGSILKSLIRKYQLENNVSFLGNLDAEGMKNEYLRANVFVCPSTIENSPNSLGEAQILGTPVVASYVGGVADMMKGDEEHLYRFEEVEMLASKVCGVFGAKDRQNDMHEVALKRHDISANLNMTLDIYREIAH